MLEHMVIAWDLDWTLFEPNPDRVRFHDDGTFDLEFWIKGSTFESIIEDKPLPLMDVFHAYQKAGFRQICMTAREISDAEIALFKKHNMIFDEILHREGSKELDHVLKSKRFQEYLQEKNLIPFQFWDDKQENLEVGDRFGFRTFHAGYMNEKLKSNGFNEIDFSPKDFI